MSIKSFTLIELIVTLVISSIIILAITSFAAFFLNAVRVNADRYNMYSQVNYAFEDMKIRCLGAIAINQPFNAANGWTRDNLEFLGEVDPYTIDDDNTTMWPLGTKVWYRYCLDNGVVGSGSSCASNATTGTLVLLRSVDGTPAADSFNLYETLVDDVFSPDIEFVYTQLDEPNFISVNITTTGTTLNAANFTTREGILFWYMDVRSD